MTVVRQTSPGSWPELQLVTSRVEPWVSTGVDGQRIPVAGSSISITIIHTAPDWTASDDPNVRRLLLAIDAACRALGAEDVDKACYYCGRSDVTAETGPLRQGSHERCFDQHQADRAIYRQWRQSLPF